jgi:predicted Rdx family selenoprotein
MIKRMVAARVAAEMKKEGADVTLERGGIGELSVSVDGREVVRSKRYWYPNPWGVMRRVRDAVRAGSP